jgi:glyceraldehyde-3-phosphate dehydrogenase/erythrose-4-phosphate dehydrogenase
VPTQRPWAALFSFAWPGRPKRSGSEGDSRSSSGGPGHDGINATVRKAAEGPMKRIVEYSEVPLVSSDIIGNPLSSIFDALSTRASNDAYVKAVAGYDNEWGYSNCAVDLMDRLAALG